MKKMMTMVMATVLLLSTSAFANESNEVNAKVRTAFQKDFSKATSVNWQTKEDFYFAEFTVNGVKLSAAYNQDGQLVATSRNIKLELLPMAVTQTLNEKYTGYTFGNNVTEISYEKQTNYYITIANSKQILHLKSNANGDINIESREKR